MGRQSHDKAHAAIEERFPVERRCRFERLETDKSTSLQVAAIGAANGAVRTWEMKVFGRSQRDSASSIRSASATVFVSIVSTQTGATVAIKLFRHVGPGGTTLLRLSFAALVLLVILRPSFRGLLWPQVRLAALFGMTLAAMNFTFYEGLSRIPLGVAVALEFVGPLAVASVGIKRPRDAVWMVLAVCGIVLLTPWGGLHLDGLGVALVLFAGCCWAFYILLSRRLGQVFPDSSGLLLALIGATIVLVPVGLASAGSSLLSVPVLAAGLVVAVLSSVVTYSFELSALRRLPTATFGVMMSLEPAVAAILGLLLLGQAIGIRAGAAIVCVVVASAGASWQAGSLAPPLIPA